MLVVNNIGAPRCQVVWGGETRVYTAAQLAAGVNLADEFAVNPFSTAFQNVDNAVGIKQNYETTQIKTDSPQRRGENATMPAVVARTEAKRAPLVDAIKAAFVPVHHVIRLVPVQD